MSNRAAPSGPDRIVFETPLVSAGEFRCPVGDRQFEDSGPTRRSCFVFPRNACWIEQQGSRAFVADSTVVPLYNQGHPYRRGAISPDGDRTDWFAVAPPVLREMVSALDRRRADDYDHLFPIPSVPATAATFLAQRYVFHHLHSGGPPDPLYVEEAVLTTLTDVLERAFGTRDLAESSLTHHRLAQRAREHLNRTYLRKESVADVAAAVGTSVFHLCRVFRRETGTSLHAYRTDLRLRRSLEWLHGRADIVDAALAAGFSHHSHFTAAFHRAFGACPSEFRAVVAGVSAGTLRVRLRGPGRMGPGRRARPARS